MPMVINSNIQHINTTRFKESDMVQIHAEYDADNHQDVF
jgi:hypothetical protein